MTFKKRPPQKRSPLWALRPTMAHAPPPARSRGVEGLPPREFTEEDMEPLRDDEEWRPVQVLKRFPPVQDDSEYLPKLLVACAVLQGVHRILELTERLKGIAKVAEPRLRQMINDDALVSQKKEIKQLRSWVELAKKELVQTRARANNDLNPDPLKPDGLRMLDLDLLSGHTRTMIRAHEVTSRRNVTGIRVGLAFANRIPDLRYAEDWLERALGTTELNGILLFWPEEYGRVIVVYEDGRLAYDPLASDEESESEDTF